MSVLVITHNVVALGNLRRLSPAGTGAQTAGASATVTGVTIDRGGFAGGSLPRSADVAVLFDATLASGKTLSVSFDVQSSPDGSTWTDFQTATSVLAATGPSGGGAVQGQVSLGVDLGAAQRYIRLNWAPVFSATGTDTSTGLACGFLAGYDRLAAPV